MVDDQQSTGGSEAAVPVEPDVAPPETSAAPAAAAVADRVPVTPASQEVRFATAMTGGVSLAVWMGGVARELNLLDQASRIRELDAGSYTAPALSVEDRMVRDLYGDLLDLLDQVIRIDVLSGTSAGGLNAAFLGLCHARGVDLGALRNTWFDAGALDLLLRDPAQKDPPSLMQGDGKFLTAMAAAVNTMAAPAPTMPARETTVYVTTTLLTGETSRFTDSYGTVVPDVDHLGMFTFSTKKLISDEPGALEALTLAARSSASFPGAFEPAFLPFGEVIAADGTLPMRPDMRTYANITKSHWVADGGILANRPIGPLLESIFARPADEREVRRVLLYIVPDPGGTPNPEQNPESESIDAPLSLGGALVHDLGAALNQSIAADLTEIRRHNDLVDSVRDTRLRLAELGTILVTNGVPFPVAAARVDFAARQGETIARRLVDRLMRALSSFDVANMPAAWRADLATGSSFEARCRNAVGRAVSAGWATTPAAGDYPALAAFGRSAYDGARATVIAIVRAAFTVAQSAEDRVTIARLGKRLASAFTPGGDEDLDTMITAKLEEGRAATPPMPLADLACAVAREHLQDAALGWNEEMPKAAPVPPVGAAAQPPADAPARPPATPALASAWRTLGLVLAETVAELDALAGTAAPPPATTTPPTPAPADPPGRLSRSAVRARAAARLRSYLDYLKNGMPQGADAAAAHIAVRLLNLHVAERSILPIGMDVEQAVELVQVSANTRSLLDLKRSNAKEKLTGVQLSHFGAFYKRSWRANDWMWGRLDGAGWLVHVLLDPRRILAVVESDPVGFPSGQRAARFADRLAQLGGPAGLVTNPTADRAKVVAELGFLDAPDLPVPASVPVSAMWLASAWQREVVNAELPVVATEVLAAPTRRDRSWALEVLTASGMERQAVGAATMAVAAVSVGGSTRASRKLLASTLQPGATAGPRSPAATDRTLLSKKLPTCPVPGETLAQERGEPLFARTLTHAAAVATAAATSMSAAPASLAPAFTTARTVTLTAYRAVDITGAVPKRTLLLGAVATTVGGLLAVQHSTVLGLTGIVVLLVGLYLLALGAWGWSRRALPILFGATLVGGVIYLCVPAGREAAFGHSHDDPGWLTRTAEPWLRERWWAILLVIAGFLVLSALWGYVAGIPGRRARRTKNATG